MQMKNRKVIIANIRKHLAHKGKSVEKLCLELEISKSWFYGFMAGKSDISLGSLERIAAGLDIEVSDLFRVN
jgi:transcriptional regulator with XRE-family HTH domain